MKNRKVDLILTVHNSQEYLKSCLNSIESQSSNEFSLIIVDDGSKDKSFKIIEDFQRQTKIPTKVIYNGVSLGVSESRNIGIRNSFNEYVTFMDSDDVILPDHISNLLEIFKLEETDLSVTSVIRTKKIGNNVNKKMSPIKNFRKLSLNESVKNILGLRDVQGFVFNKMFKRKIILESNIQFNNNIYICEDLLFSIQYICASSRGIVLSSNSTYLYRINPTSVLSTRNSKEEILRKGLNEKKAYELMYVSLKMCSFFNRHLESYFFEKYTWVINNTIYSFSKFSTMSEALSYFSDYPKLVKSYIVRIIWGFYIPTKPKFSFILRYIHNACFN